jgi:HPt (histidine-containing phosphotransfer) domain-containing protein
MSNLKTLLDRDAPELLDELVELYLQDAPVQLSGIIGAIRGGDADLAADAAHALKGSSAYMGAGALASLCSRIEKLSAARDLEEAARLLGQLEAEFASARCELEVQLTIRRNGKAASN